MLDTVDLWTRDPAFLHREMGELPPWFDPRAHGLPLRAVIKKLARALVADSPTLLNEALGEGSAPQQPQQSATDPGHAEVVRMLREVHKEIRKLKIACHYRSERHNGAGATSSATPSAERGAFGVFGAFGARPRAADASTTTAGFGAFGVGTSAAFGSAGRSTPPTCGFSFGTHPQTAEATAARVDAFGYGDGTAFGAARGSTPAARGFVFGTQASTRATPAAAPAGGAFTFGGMPAFGAAGTSPQAAAPSGFSFGGARPPQPAAPGIGQGGLFGGAFGTRAEAAQETPPLSSEYLRNLFAFGQPAQGATQGAFQPSNAFHCTFSQPAAAAPPAERLEVLDPGYLSNFYDTAGKEQSPEELRARSMGAVDVQQPKNDHEECRADVASASAGTKPIDKPPQDDKTTPQTPAECDQTKTMNDEAAAATTDNATNWKVESLDARRPSTPAVAIRKLALTTSSEADRIAKGAYSTVYKATMNDAIPVAAKVAQNLFGKAAIARFEREMAALRSRPDHPHLVRHYGHVWLPGRDQVGVVSELLPVPQSLRSRLYRTKRPIHEKTKHRVLLELLEALVVLHAHGITHRDLSPAHVLFSLNSWSIKLVDFGLPTLKNAAASGHITGPGFAPAYASPELLRGELASHNVESWKKSDVFSFAVVLCEVLTEESPWEGELPVTVAKTIESARPFAVENLRVGGVVSPALERTVARAWHSDPALRPTAAELLDELYEVFT